MIDDDFEVEWKMPKADLRLGYPIDCTKNKSSIFDFDFQRPDPNFVGVLRSAREYEMLCRITLQRHLARWAYDTLGYIPQLQVYAHANIDAAAYLLKFASETDGILFRIRFGGLFR
jgi:hypothetical protein